MPYSGTLSVTLLVIKNCDALAKIKGSEFVPAFRPVKSNSWYNQIRDGNIGVCLDQNSPIFSTFL